MELKLNDIVFMHKWYCERFRISDDAKTLIRINANGDKNYHTIKYGYGGHDINIKEIDWERTKQFRRNEMLNELLG